MAVTVILLWIRLLKNARAFAYLGMYDTVNQYSTSPHAASACDVITSMFMRVCMCVCMYCCVSPGPFIVMLTLMLSDFVKFALLYLEFFIPFCEYM